MRKKRDLEIKTEHGGSYKRWLDHTWHQEKRALPKHELHERWFSTTIASWFNRM